LLFPSKLIIGCGIPRAPITRCTAVSGTTGPSGAARIGPCSSFSRSVHFFQGSGFMLRSGGEMSNCTTGMTPRYWARTMGCELPDWPEGVRGCANRTSVIAPKQSKTANRRRSLKNADWEVDLFFMGFGLDCAGVWPTDCQRWNALVSESARACQHNFDSLPATGHALRGRMP